MASFEIVSGDFEPEVVRIRYSEAGRARIRLTSVDGVVEDVFLATDVVGAADAREGRVGEYLARWAERDGGASLLGSARRGETSARVFAVVLRDGRKFVARGTPETLAEIKEAALGTSRRTPQPVATKRPEVPPEVAGRPRFVQGFLARFLPGR
jgi:hypothetical protein